MAAHAGGIFNTGGGIEVAAAVAAYAGAALALPCWRRLRGAVDLERVMSWELHPSTPVLLAGWLAPTWPAAWRHSQRRRRQRHAGTQVVHVSLGLPRAFARQRRCCLAAAQGPVGGAA